MAAFQSYGGQAGAYNSGGAVAYGGGRVAGGAGGYGAGGVGGAGGMQAGGAGGTGGGAGGMGGVAYAGGGRGGFFGGGGSAGGVDVEPGCCGVGGGQARSGGTFGGAGVVPGGAGLAAGGCIGTDCGVGCDGTARGSLAFVGEGRGAWITETTYTYVGEGAGDLAVVTTRRAVWPWILLAALLLAAVLAVLFWPDAATTTRAKFNVRPAPPPTTTPQPPVIKKSCIFWGDPHLVTFDGARPSFYGDGEFWIVKSKDVHIQGRYMGTKYTYGLAATQKVAIGGPFLDGHVIEIEPMEHAYGGKIMVDGTEVLRSFGMYSVANGLAEIKYNGDGELVDGATSKWTTRAVHLDLPRGIRMTVFRWGNYLDLKITMPKEEGQDGSCGNFNGDAQDDSTLEIFKRIGARVPEEELMFSHRAVVTMTREEETMLTTQCPRSTLANAKDSCDTELPRESSAAQLAACAFDYCFGMVEHALVQAKKFATSADQEAAHANDFD